MARSGRASGFGVVFLALALLAVIGLLVFRRSARRREARIAQLAAQAAPPAWLDPQLLSTVVASENLDSCVSMVQSAEDRMRNNASEPLDWACAGRILPERNVNSYFIACLSGCHPQPLAVVFGHAHGHSPAWQSSVPTIAPRVPATFSRRRGLRRLPGEGSLERRVCLPPLSAEEYLPIIHLVFANLKTWLNGIHHGVSHQHLQAYLNEFTFRFNKRFYPFNAFRSLLGIAGDVTAPYLRRALLRSLAASYM